MTPEDGHKAIARIVGTLKIPGVTLKDGQDCAPLPVGCPACATRIEGALLLCDDSCDCKFCHQQGRQVKP